MDLTKIEDRIDKTASASIAVSGEMGGVQLQDMLQVMEMAKMMAISKEAVPKHLRGEPGICLAICVQALEWKMSPFSVANKSYVVNDRIAYESQLIHAVIEARAPLKERLRERYEGEGTSRVCIISGHIKGELEPREYRSPPISQIKVKHSPLWTADPDQQLFYYSSRAWARRHTPDVLLGIYSDDELRDADPMQDITPKPDLASRLTGAKGKRGFSKAGVDQALIEHKPGQTLDTAPMKEKEPVEVRSDATAGGDGAAPKEEAAEPVDELSEWLDEQIAISNNLKASEELDELDPRVWKRLRDAGRAKDLGEKWETEGFNPNMNRLDPARKAKK